MADRATSPVVGKALEAGLVVLYIGLLSSVLYGQLVPEYRSAAGAEVGDRVLAQTSQEIQQAVPQNASRVDARVRVTLPETLRGASYEIRPENRSLVLDHPHRAVGGRARLALPAHVTAVRGGWRSGDPAVVRVRSDGTGLVVTLERGRR